jgi:hypothetical protein
MISVAVRNKSADQQRYIVLYDDADTEELKLVEIHGELRVFVDYCLESFF